MKKCPRMSYTSPRADPRESQLPWASNSLSVNPSHVQLSGAGRGPESVCARAVASGTCRGAGTSGIARIRSACGCYAAGNRPDGSGAGGPAPRPVNTTDRPSGPVDGKPSSTVTRP